MRTSDLINQLSSDLRPVRPQLSPIKFAAAFSLVGFVAVCAGLMMVHVRTDLAAKLSSATFDLDVFLSLGLMLSAMVVVGRLSAPGQGRARVWLAACLVFTLSIIGFGLLRAGLLDRPSLIGGLDVAGAKCFLTAVGISLLPSLAISIATCKRAPLRPKMIGVVMALACIGAGTLGITLHCTVDNGMHIALYHFLLPIIVGVISGFAIGTKSLKW